MRTPLLTVYNQLVNQIRWCTPSISPRGQLKTIAIYDNDMSISMHSMGNPLTDSGVFGKATKLAAKAYKSDFTLFGVNGSSGANMTVLRALQSLGKRKILASRNQHVSVLNAVDFFNLELTFLPLHYNQEWEMVEPNSAEEVIKEVKSQKPDVLLLTSPTYEGNVFDLKKIITKVRKINKNIIIFIDEAWGAHLPFLGEGNIPCAMDSGADICVQSTHKMGGALQQTAMIHWSKKRIPYETMLKAYQECSTTSPSFHLLADLDANRALMEESGIELLSNAAYLSGYLKGSILKMGFDIFLTPDLFKITVKFKDYPAHRVAEELEKRNIICEKYGNSTVMFIVGLHNTLEDVEATSLALKEALSCIKKQPIVQSSFPDSINSLEHGDKIKSFIWKSAIGQMCAENVIPYPPGIALLSKGDLITKKHINYLREVKKNKTTILMKNLNKIDVFI